MIINNIVQFNQLYNQLLTQPQFSTIIVGNGTCCRAVGSESVVIKVKQVIKDKKMESKIKIRMSGCLGYGEQDPIIIIRPQGVFYGHVKPEDVDKIIEDNFIKNETDLPLETEVGFFKKQKRWLISKFSEVDPLNIEDYIKIGGYSALIKVLSLTPEQVIEIIKKSGLRGRGGAGFPTGLKWESCREANVEANINVGQGFSLANNNATLKGLHYEAQKYVICNADEGDPGAFMDRSLLEGNPHSVIEGIIIGAYAIGAEKGYIYVRDEYPLAVEHLKIALAQAYDYGFLGKNILGTKINFDLEIICGAGAFVCGESSALRASIEGRVGEPSVKYIHATEKGLWDKPTVLNNVKTWANIPLIINNGDEWFSSLGTEKSKGTMIFSLVGKVNNTGLVEVPMGITLRELIYDIGGGILEGRKIKAIQTGGPSGGCIPASLLDLPVDYEALTQAGSMMCSGGM